MYVRQARQFLRSSVQDFDERKYGFASVVDLLRAAGKEGVLRIERDRQGAVRVFPGANMVQKPVEATDPAINMDETFDVVVPAERIGDSEDITSTEAQAESAPDADDEAPAKAAPKKGVRKRKSPAPRPPRSRSAQPAKPRARRKMIVPEDAPESVS